MNGAAQLVIKFLLAGVVNPVPFWVLGVLCLGIWMLFRPRATEPGKIFLLIVFLLLIGPFLDAVMNAESRNFPWKFDYFLYLVDKNLGISAFSVARLISQSMHDVLFVVYQSLVAVMVLWYGVNLKTKGGKPNQLLLAYAVSFALAPFLYLIVPSCGPRHAFKSAFPMGNPDVSPVLIQLNGWPNAMPSLHVSTALLFVLFAGRDRVVRALAWGYLAGTVGATLVLEHYLIDLIVAVPYACFATLAASKRILPALGNLAAVVAWELALRFATPSLIVFPTALRVLALATVCLPAMSLMTGRKALGSELLEPDPSFSSP